MNWIELLVWPMSGIVAGFVGGCTVAWRWGARMQRIEDRLNQHNGKLQDGTERIRAVPVLQTQLEVILSEIRDIKRELREAYKIFQTKDVCEAKHGD